MNDPVIEPNWQELVNWLRKSAEQGIAHSQFLLGICHMEGEGVKKDAAEAVNWFRKAAEQGHADAQNALGCGYASGIGVKQDYVRAVEWFRKSAERGTGFAQFNLGVSYEQGNGVDQDYAEAVKWFRKSAEQGHVDAQCKLGASYEQGKGVAKDLKEAVKWYRMAAERDNSEAKEALKRLDELKRSSAALTPPTPGASPENSVKRNDADFLLNKCHVISVEEKEITIEEFARRHHTTVDILRKLNPDISLETTSFKRNEIIFVP